MHTSDFCHAATLVQDENARCKTDRMRANDLLCLTAASSASHTHTHDSFLFA